MIIQQIKLDIPPDKEHLLSQYMVSGELGEYITRLIVADILGETQPNETHQEESSTSWVSSPEFRAVLQDVFESALAAKGGTITTQPNKQVTPAEIIQEGAVEVQKLELNKKNGNNALNKFRKMRG